MFAQRKGNAGSFDGLSFTPDGRVDPEGARALLAQIVVIRIELFDHPSG
jgi:hypothetical protein